MRRRAGLAQPPAGDIRLMNTLIANIAITGIPEPVPVIMEAVGIEGAHFRRAHPKVIIDFFRNGRRAGGRFDFLRLKQRPLAI